MGTVFCNPSIFMILCYKAFYMQKRGRGTVGLIRFLKSFLIPAPCYSTKVIYYCYCCYFGEGGTSASFLRCISDMLTGKWDILGNDGLSSKSVPCERLSPGTSARD